MAQGVALRRAPARRARRRSSCPRARPQTKLAADRALRRPRRPRALRRVVAVLVERPLRGRRRPLRAPGRRREGDGGQRHDRPRAARADLPDFDAVVVPYGGGGLLTGIASAVKAQRPGVRFYAAEPETGAPVAATLAAGEPTAVDYVPLVRRRLGQPRADPARVGAGVAAARRRVRACRSTRRPPPCA